jgi:hypothetical protein
MFTNAEKLSIEERETRRYEATIVRPLMAIAPKDSWTMIIDNQETKIFNHKTLISVIGDIAIGKLRKIERVIRSEGDITLKSDDRLYLGAFGNDGNLILTPIQQNTDSGK